MRRLFLALAVFVTPVAAAAQTSQWVEAKVERPVPAEAAALGHHGVVTLEGDIAPDGRTANMIVATSSRSPLLDAEALRLFGSPRPVAPGLRANGQTKIRIRLDFNNYDLNNMGLGYLCGQAVRDADWFATVSPRVAFERSDFSLYLQGTGMIVEKMAFAQDDKKFAAAWTAALTHCRKHPDAPFMGFITLAGNNKLPRQ